MRAMPLESGGRVVDWLDAVEVKCKSTGILYGRIYSSAVPYCNLSVIILRQAGDKNFLVSNEID